MINFLYFILSVWGLTHLLVSSKILIGFRNWCLIRIPFIGEMLECYQCTSFWVSFILFPIFPCVVFNTYSFSIFDIKLNFDLFVASFISSGSISFMSVVFSFLIHKK